MRNSRRITSAGPETEMDTIISKTLLYRSGLGFHCVNHAQGCGHGFLYPCYVYMMAHSYGRAKTSA